MKTKKIKYTTCSSCKRKFVSDGFRKCGPCNLKRKPLKKSGLCDSLIPGCTCNQWSFGG